MQETFERFYRHFGRAVMVVLFVALGLLGLALLSALAGFTHAVISFRQAATAAAFLFLGLLVLFLLTSLIAALIRYLWRPAEPNV